MKQVIGIIMIICGISLGLYAGVWWAFIGGIVDVVECIRAEDLIALNLATGVAKVIFAGLIGFMSGFILFIPGVAMARS